LGQFIVPIIVGDFGRSHLAGLVQPWVIEIMPISNPTYTIFWLLQRKRKKQGSKALLDRFPDPE
jgi:hypothetical protein